MDTFALSKVIPPVESLYTNKFDKLPPTASCANSAISAVAAIVASAVVIVEAYEASFHNAAASSFKVFNAAGAAATTAAAAVEAALSAYVFVANADVSAIPCTLVLADVCEDNSESLAIAAGICESGTLPSGSNEATPSATPISDTRTYVVPD